MLYLGINSNNDCGGSSAEIFANIKQAGFTHVMVAAKTGKFEHTLAEAREMGLQVPYVHLDYSGANDLWAKGLSNKRYIDNVISQLETCAKFGIRVAVTHATRGSASVLALPPNEHGLESMKIILEKAKKLGIKIALENCDEPNFKNFQYLLDNIDSEWLGLCYDAGHHNLYNPDFPLLEKYGDRILAVHLHDNMMDWEYGYDYTRDMHYMPFDGKIDYEKVMKKIAKTPYNNAIMLEIHKNSTDEPKIYKDMSYQEFLGTAYLKARDLAEIFENARKA